MRMRATLTVMIILLTPLSGCFLSNDPDEDVRYMYVGAKSVEVFSLTRESVVFDVLCGTPVPCWEFSRADVFRSGRDVEVRVQAKYVGNDPCITVTGEITARVEIPIEDSGPHDFHFWRHDDVWMDTTLVFVRSETGGE